MRQLHRAAATAALMLPLAVAPATAQNHRGAWGIYGGGIWISDLNEEGPFDRRVVFDDLDIIDDLDLIGAPVILDGLEIVSFGDLSLDSRWLVGTQAEYWWYRGWFAARLNLAYTQTDFDPDVSLTLLDVARLDGDVIVGDILGVQGRRGFGDVNTWLIGVDGMARILEPRPGRVWAPFISLGPGLVIYDPAGDGSFVFPTANAVWRGSEEIRVVDDSIIVVQADDGGNRKTRFAVAVGIGADILPDWRVGDLGVGFRLELADHIVWDSPVDPIITDGRDDDFGPVHNVRFTAGVHGLFGRLFPEVQVVAAQPAPPAPPAEETVTVCVVDPSTYEVEYVSAVYVPGARDTLVVRNGRRRPLRSVYPESPPLYVANADWYVAGRPLTVTVAGEESEWVLYGGARIIDAEDLAFLGTVEGTPVYADAEEVEGIRDELARARTTTDLERRLEAMAGVREAFREIRTVYVPLEPGCVFHALRRVEEVRKIRD